MARAEVPREPAAVDPQQTRALGSLEAELPALHLHVTG